MYFFFVYKSGWALETFWLKITLMFCVSLIYFEWVANGIWNNLNSRYFTNVETAPKVEVLMIHICF
jgi:hypothetical protein